MMTDTSIKFSDCNLSKLIISVRVHGPDKLAQKSFGENLLDLDLVLLAPGHADSGVIVVGLAGAQSNLLAVVLLLQDF